MSAHKSDGVSADEQGLEEFAARLETADPEAVKAMIAALHPADLAEMLNTVGRPESRRKVFALLDTPAAFGRAWNLGGAGVTTQRELAQMAYGGRPRYMVAGKMMLRLLGLFDPFLREFVEMHYLMTDPLIVDDAALQQLLGAVPKTPYSEGVRQSLAAAG